MISILKFEAQWCQPCHVFSPVFKAVMLSYADNDAVEFKVIDIDEDPDSATKFGVRSIPTMVLVDDDDNVLETVVGGMREQDLKSLIEKAIGE